MRPGLDFTGVNVGFLCHDDQGRVLFHQRSEKCRDEHNTWDGGGGRVQFGERLEDALRREIKEEYGCDIIRFSHIAQLELLRDHEGRTTHWLANVYLVHVSPSEVRVMEPEKNLGNEWYSFESLPKPMHSAVAGYINDYGDRIRQLMQNHLADDTQF